MHQPGLDAEIPKGGEVCLDEDADGFSLLGFPQGALFKPSIVMCLCS